MKSRMLLGLCLFFVLSYDPLYSQTVQGDIVGTVRDPQGDVVPEAAITIINEGTGAVRHLKSDERGEYHAIGFFQGIYRVEVEKSGFQKVLLYERSEL